MSFSSADELKAEMLKKIPHKIDIGAVFNAKPSDHKKIANFQVKSPHSVEFCALHTKLLVLLVESF